MIYFDDEISAVLAQSSNLSYSSRADRWKGISQGVVATQGAPVKTPKNKKRNFYYILCCVIAFVLAAAITTVVCLFAKMSIIVGLLVACLDIIAVAIICVVFVVIAFNNVVGKRRFERPVERNFEDE